MLLLGIDFETTGLESAVDVVTEVGAILWDTDLQAPVKLMGFLVKTGDTPFGEVAAEITGLNTLVCDKYGHDSERALKQVLAMYQQADYICAHNAPFDHGFLKAWIKKHNIEFAEDKVWIDTSADIPLPKGIRSRHLPYLAVEHGFLNPFPHRAVFDVMTMFRVLSNYDINEVVKSAQTPSIYVKAVGDRGLNDKIKACGYRAKYEGGRFIAWLLVIKQDALEHEKARVAEAGFSIVVVDENGY